MMLLFLQKQEHITFVGGRGTDGRQVGYRINYEGGGTAIAVNRGYAGPAGGREHPRRRVLCRTVADPGCAEGAGPLTERDFDGVAAASFGCGYAPTAGTR